jgi:transposase
MRGHAAKGAALPRQLGIDEKAIAKGHRYMTLVCDLQEATVEYIGEERSEESLAGYFRVFPVEQRQQIEAICLDMWQPYVNVCRAQVPGAADKMVFDRFHIMRHVLAAVDTVRKREHRALLEEGDTSLAKTKYLWLYNVENIPERAQEYFDNVKSLQLKTARAWALKEALRELWTYRVEGWAKRFWARWYFWATHSRLAPIIKAAKLIRRHLHNVLTYFRHRVTNAVAEGLNSKIATVQKRACGYRNRDHFKIAIYFHCGGLNLYPVQATHTKAG